MASPASIDDGIPSIKSADDDRKTSNEDRTPQFITSPSIGNPPYVLDPEDLDACYDLAPGKVAAKIRRVEDDVVVKYGRDVHLAEAEAMHLVATRTNVRCPKLIGAYVLDGVGYIIMSYVKGLELSRYWKSADETKRENVISQLSDYVKEMRTIKGTYIGGVDHTPPPTNIFEWCYVGCPTVFGPFDGEASWNEGIIEAFKNKIAPDQRLPLDPTSSGYNISWKRQQLIRSFKNHDIVFTHGDLNEANIIIQEDDTVALIDWGNAGYFPEYWEYHTATSQGTFQPDFIRQIERFIPPYYMEAFVMDHLRSKMIS